jgi:hypothetical protein
VGHVVQIKETWNACRILSGESRRKVSFDKLAYKHKTKMDLKNIS